MKALRVLATLLCLSAGLTAPAAIPSDALLDKLAREVGVERSFVNDFAHVLSPAERDALEQRVRALQQKTTAELAVVTVASLEGGQIDDFANKLFRRLGVGLKGQNNGVLLLVAIADRKMRIEVGYGLEPVVPDVLAGRIIDEELRPQFRANRYAEGLRLGVERLAGLIERGETPSRVGLAASGLYRRNEMPLSAQFSAIAFLALFVAFGMYLGGAALATRTIFMVIWGFGFGGIPLVMAFMMGGLPPFVLVPWGVVVFCLGFRAGYRNPKMFSGSSGMRRGRRGRGGASWHFAGGDWSSGGGGFSSGGDSGGGFGGGDSGGGGASGSW